MPDRWVRLLVLLLCIPLLGAVQLASGATQPDAASELLTNGGFEDGAAPWRKDSNRESTFNVVEERPHTGKRAAALTPPPDGQISVSQIVEVATGAEYRLAGWALWEDPAYTQVELRLHWYASDEISHTPLQFARPDSDWQTLESGWVRPPRNATHARVVMFLRASGADPNEPVLFDDISLSQKPDPTPTPEPTATEPPEANVFINEVLSRPLAEIDCNRDGKVTSADDEWVELYLAGDHAVDLDGWKLDDGPGGSQVFLLEHVRMHPSPSGRFFALCSEETRIELNNDGDRVRLFRPDDTLADEVVVPALEPDRSLSRYPDGDEDLSTEWLPTLNGPNGSRGPVPTPTPEPTGSPDPTGTPRPTQTPTKSPTPGAPTVTAEPDPTATPTPGPRDVSIADARKAEEDELVRVRGVVTAPAHLVGARRLYLQDETAGILLVVPEDTRSYAPGDLLEATGATGTHYGERSIRVREGALSLMRSGSPQPRPREIKSGEAGALTEGLLVRLRGEVVSVNKPSIRLDDGTGQARVRIAGSTAIPWPSPHRGDTLTAVGVVSSFNGSYRVLPRYARDLTLVRPLPPTATPNPTSTSTPTPGATASPSNTATPPATSTTAPETIPIKEARESAEGATVRVLGVVTARAYAVGSRRLYVQDGTAGILVVIPEEAQGFRPGDLLEITGVAGTYYGERCVRVDGNGMKLAGRGEEPDVREIDTGDVGPGTEGLLVQVEGTVTQVNKPSIRLNDGSGETRVRVADSTGIEWPSPHKDDTLVATGVVSSFNGRYRILPRRRGDLELTRRAEPTETPTSTPSPQPSGTPEAEEPPRTVNIATARTLPEGETVRVVGSVTAPSHVTGAGRLYIQDASSGILVLVPDGTQPFNPGDVVSITGSADTYYGEHALRIGGDGDIRSLRTGAEPPARDIATGGVGPATEGLLVRLEGRVTQVNRPGVRLNDGSGEARLRIADSAGITWPSPHRDDTLRAVGVVSSFNGSYRVLPRYEHDLALERVAAPAPQRVTVRAARTAPEGALLLLDGVVTAPPGPLGESRMYIQDSTAGILVSAVPEGVPLQGGDRVRLVGTSGSTNGERLLRLEATGGLQALGGGAPPAAVSVSLAEIGPVAEGSLVEIRGTVAQTAWPSIYLEEPSGDARVYAKESAGIDNPGARQGDTLRAVGIVSSYRGAYRLLPFAQAHLAVTRSSDGGSGGPDPPGGGDGDSGYAGVPISTARAAPGGKRLVIRGAVTAPARLLGERLMYVQDSTGGILVTGDLSPSTPGQVLQIEGEAGTYHGERRLAAHNVTPLYMATPVTPQLLSLSEVGSQTEGLLVSAEGPVTRSGWPSLYLGEEEMRVYAQLSTGIPNPGARSGDRAAVTGVVSQWDGKYRLLLRFPTDLVVTTADEPPPADTDSPPETDRPEEDEGWLDVEIAGLRSLPLGSRVRFEGQVTAPPGPLGAHRAYVGSIDAGVALHLPGGGYPALVEGDRILVRGALDTYHGELVVRLRSASDVTSLGPGPPVLPASMITGAIGAGTEGRLVTVSGKITARSWPSLELDDGSGVARIQALDSAGIPMLPGGRDDLATVTGVVSQWDGRWRVLPRRTSDLTITPVTPTGLDNSTAPNGEADAATWQEVTLSQARGLPMGTRVRFEAQITVPPGLLGEERAYAGTPDAGVALHLSDGSYPSLSEGDRVQVQGEIDTYYGEIVVRLASGADVTWLGSSAPLGSLSVGTSDIGSITEGRLVTVEGSITARSWPSLEVDDGAGPAHVQVLESTGIPSLEGGKDDAIIVTGVVSQRNGRWRVLPRWTADLKLRLIPTSVPRTGAGWIPMLVGQQR